MPNNQVQIRRDTATNLSTTTPANGELAYDTTNKRLRVGDGSTTGGIYQASAKDVQQSAFTYLTAGGTANALTATMAPAISSYVAGLSVRVKATANNTGAATINLNGLGTKDIKKRSGGTLASLAANDMINGGVYELLYDGTQFQIMSTEAGAGIISVSQGNINTSTGIVSIASSGSSPFRNSGIFTLPGGSYGFYPEIRKTGSFSPVCAAIIGGDLNFTTASGINAWVISASASISSTYAAYISLAVQGSGAVAYAQQRYITSSPPYDLGDGEVGGFIFALVDSSGNIMAHYSADAPPWAYNGPTDIRCQHICPITGKKHRKVMKKRSLEEIMNGAKVEYELEEITHKIKNADMGLIPHPFGTVPDGHKIVLIDPMDDRIRDLIDYQNAGGGDDVAKALLSGKIYVDNEPLKRKGPKSIIQAGLRFKYTRS